jgi:hypothetical protein
VNNEMDPPENGSGAGTTGCTSGSGGPVVPRAAYPCDMILRNQFDLI